jgi:hypothetical protein
MGEHAVVVEKRYVVLRGPISNHRKCVAKHKWAAGGNVFPNVRSVPIVSSDGVLELDGAADGCE